VQETVEVYVPFITDITYNDLVGDGGFIFSEWLNQWPCIHPDVVALHARLVAPSIQTRASRINLNLKPYYSY
jgi:hypothetical protein